MACLYRRRNNFWVSYRINGKLVQRSLNTSDKRVSDAEECVQYASKVIGPHGMSGGVVVEIATSRHPQESYEAIVEQKTCGLFVLGMKLVSRMLLTFA